MEMNPQAITKRTFIRHSLWISLSLFSSYSYGLTFVLPHNGNIIGHIQNTTVQAGESLSTIGRRYDIGGYEMLEANPNVSFLNPAPGTPLLIPSRFILPDTPRQGIVINLAEMRLYYYHSDNIHVSTYPVGVGKEGWSTPLGKTTITQKREHPTWVVPDSIMENHLQHGMVIPKVKPPGPDNPLGDYALNLGFKGESIVIHGTPFPQGVGVRGSHGCIRMLNEDVGDLFRHVKIGTPVYIIHQPTKIGRLNEQLYLEAHVPISDALYHADYRDTRSLIQKIVEKIGKRYTIEWHEVQRLQNHATGYPQPIGTISY